MRLAAGVAGAAVAVRDRQDTERETHVSRSTTHAGMQVQVDTIERALTLAAPAARWPPPRRRGPGPTRGRWRSCRPPSAGTPACGDGWWLCVWRIVCRAGRCVDQSTGTHDAPVGGLRLGAPDREAPALGLRRRHGPQLEQGTRPRPRQRRPRLRLRLRLLLLLCWWCLCCWGGCGRCGLGCAAAGRRLLLLGGGRPHRSLLPALLVDAAACAAGCWPRMLEWVDGEACRLVIRFDPSSIKDAHAARKQTAR